MFSRDTYKLIELLFPLKEHCFCLTDLFMIIILFYFFIYFLVIPTESKVQEIKQCSCQVQVQVNRYCNHNGGGTREIRKIEK